MKNAKQELINHVQDRQVKHVEIVRDCDLDTEKRIAGTLEEVLPQLDFEYDNGYGCQQLSGLVWYEDGTWSERGAYDGSEWWERKKCPPIPEH